MFDNTSLSFVNPNLLSEIPSGSRSYDPDVSIVGKGAEDIQTVAKAPSRSLFHWSGLVVLCRLMSFGQPSESKRKARTLGWLLQLIGGVVNENHLCVKVLRSKYKCLEGIPPSLERRQYSRLWKGVSLVWPEVLSSLVWKVGNSSKVDFWHDAWLGDFGPLINWVTNPAVIDQFQLAPITSMVDSDGAWKWQTLEHILPVVVLHRLSATKPPLDEGGDDVLGWKWFENRLFSVRSAYTIGMKLVTDNTNTIWSNISKYNGLPRIKNQQTGLSACGGVIRNAMGTWVVGFAQYLDSWSIVEFELWGIHVGLSHAWNLGYRKLLNNDWEVVIRVVDRICNRVADGLAKHANSPLFDSKFFQAPPDCILQALHEDCSTLVT
ncbi:hypothetical protein V6N13_064706 [Hibiscus sabdariffa]